MLPLLIYFFIFFFSSSPTVRASNAPVSGSVPDFMLINDYSPPTIPILVKPKDLSFVDNYAPEFVWRQSLDPNGNFVEYLLYLNGIQAFQGISNTANIQNSKYSSQVIAGEVRLISNNALSDGHYSWYVVARDKMGNTARSATWSFTILTTLPTSLAVITSSSRPLNPLLYSLLVLPLLFLILLYRRDNIQLLSLGTNKPLSNLTIQKIVGNKKYVDLTNRRGLAYLPHLKPRDIILVTLANTSTLHLTLLRTTRITTLRI